MRWRLLLPVVLPLAGCKPPERAVEAVAVDPPPLPVLTADAAQSVTPVVLEAVDAVSEFLPPPPPPEAAPEPAWVGVAVPYIIRWEVTSPAVYSRRYAGVVWPGGASGPTWGVGWDGGMATRAEIKLAWSIHPQVDRLESAAGVTGKAARDRVRAGEWRGVLTPYPMAEDVFRLSSLPTYGNAARRVMGPAVFDALAPVAQATWVGTVYNRGGSLTGDSRREMQVIVRQCAPQRDYRCMADQYRAMCRVWRGRDVEAGLCARYAEAARMVESG